MEYGQMVNEITLHGRAVLAPQPSHRNHGEIFYAFPLAVRRLSGVEDRLNVLLPQRVLPQPGLEEGSEVTVQGEVRSFNNKSGQGSRLVITVYARRLTREPAEDDNRLRLAGVLCKPPVYRRTPLGRDICDMMLAVNRRYGRADYLPCISWGALARRCGALAVGDFLRLDGRLQSRTYTKRLENAEEERTAYEVSVMSMDLGESGGE